MTQGAELTASGRAVRLGAAAVVLGLLAYGTGWGSDDHFPVGPMTQYAFAAHPDSDIKDHFVEADTTAGTRVRVPLTSRGVGMSRAEVEGQLPAIVADPSRLQGLADAHRRLHPDRPQYVRLYLRLTRIDLEDGVAVGRTTETLATWDVR